MENNTTTHRLLVFSRERILNVYYHVIHAMQTEMKHLFLLVLVLLIPIALQAQEPFLSISADSTEIAEKEPGFLSFSLKRSDPESLSQMSSSEFSSHEDSDSFKYDLKGMTITDLYSMALGMPKYRIVFNENEINPDSLRIRYDMSFSGKTEGGKSGDPRKKIKSLLNYFWGLDTRNQEIETEVWILKGVTENNSIVRITETPASRSGSSSSKKDVYSFENDYINLAELASIIEGAIGKSLIVVEPDNGADDRYYSIKMSVKHDGQQLERWFQELSNAGVKLEKGKRMINYLVIDSVD